MRSLFWGILAVWNTILGISGQITIVILLVLLCRVFVGKVSKQASYFLWGIVAIRLLFPIMPESELSVFNAVGYLDNHISQEAEDSDKLLEMFPEMQNEPKGNTDERVASDTKETMTDTLEVGFIKQADHMAAGISKDLLFREWKAMLWFCGMLIMTGYGIMAYLLLKHRLRFATTTDHEIYEAETITSPFVFGILRPKIYLPYHLSEEAKYYILLHENYHIKRKDYFVKLTAFLLLAVYWFQPFVWVAFFLMSRDMELSCDEQVLKKLGIKERKAYSRLLLELAAQRPIHLYAPVSFGENDTKRRIKSILSYKKPTFRRLLAAFVFMAALVLCCLTDAKKDKWQESVDRTEIKAYEEMTDEELFAFAERLYAVKNPYIGDASGNGKILTLLMQYYDVGTGGGMELQTTDMPYWITLKLTEQTDAVAMWKLAAVFLALTENATELRWEFADTDGKIYHTYYVQTDTAEALLDCENIKAYAASPEKIKELLHLLEKKEKSIVVQQSRFPYYANEAELPWNLANQYELRLQQDNISYRDSAYHEICACIYTDFDHSGEMDFALCVRNNIENKAVLYLYMNHDSLYTKELPMNVFDMEIISGDLDHDGRTELVYKAFNGGNGGAGGYVKGILKYQNHTFAEMPLPGDFAKEEAADGEAGYEISVYYGKEADSYEIVCHALGRTNILEKEYLKDENGAYLQKPQAGEQIGGNCRGFFDFSIVTEDGKDYLTAYEYIHGEDGVNYGIGYVRFSFDWNDRDGWIIKDYEIINL